MDVLYSKPYPSAIQGFVAYLMKDNAFLASILSQRKGKIVLGEICF